MFPKIIFVLATVCIVNASVADADTVPDNSASSIEDSVSSRKCTHEQCNTLCHKLKFREGVCIAGRCSCNNYFPIPNDVNDLDEFTQDKNFLSDDSLSTEDFEESIPVSELSENPRGCNPQACHRLCRRIKQAGGACVNGRCKCDHFLGTEDVVDEYSELDTRRCRVTKCNRTCTRRGFDGATCVEGRCKCHNITKTPLPLSELSEDPTKRGCNPQACHQLCRRIKRAGGVCVNGRCKCDIFLGTGGNANEEYAEVDTRRVCSLWKCNRTCTRRGYAGARCVNGWCKCHDKIQREDATPLNNVASDENEESYDILKTNEEKLTPRWSLDCNIFKCTEKCYHLKFDLGYCRKGRCECYKNK